MSKPVNPTPITRPFRHLWPEPQDDPHLVKLVRVWAKADDRYQDAQAALPNTPWGTPERRAWEAWKEALLRHRQRRASRLWWEVSERFLKLDYGQWVQVDRAVYWRRSDGQHVGMKTVRTNAVS